ncbi:hypothetical protein QYF36_017738 [Acer negundo]|nr:hypothetical protein QYF36_017738 [Acer negundo]
MVSNSSYRKSFIDSSIKLARLYRFQGLDLSWVSANMSTDMSNMGVLFQEWKGAIDFESRNSSQTPLVLTAAVHYSPLILTAAVKYSPNPGSASFPRFPIDSMQQYLNWVHVMAYDFYMPTWSNFTRAQAALYDPSSTTNANYGIGEWINGGLSADKIVLSLPFYGYAWTLVNPANNSIGAPATGPAIKPEGVMTFKEIKDYISRNGAVKIKVSYAKKRNLLGYVVWQVSNDDNWVLSQAAAAQEDNKNGQNTQPVFVIILTTTATVILQLGILIYYCCIRFKMLKSSKGKVNSAKDSKNKRNSTAAGDFNSNAPNLIVYNLTDIEAYKLWKDDKGMDFMDPSLDDTFSSCKLMTCLHIALLCVQETPNDRPTMLEVFSMLKNEATYKTIPKKPAFSRQTDENEQNKSAMHLEMCSVNDATLSEVVAR